MWIEWVNHASFIVESASVRLICDPWLSGTAFNQGWSLLSPTKLKPEEFDRITHIWFSHEHPDHFSPQNLRNIPEAIRRNIKVLFQRTDDKRVIGACRHLGFKTDELPAGKVVFLAPDFSVLCGTLRPVDSWLSICAEGKTLLNMNDCVFKSEGRLQAIKHRVGKIDVLLTQFSYANWVGNPDDALSHLKHAKQKLDEIARQVRLFEPAQFVPFASFIVFAHKENSFMNQAANRIGDVFEYAERTLNVGTVVLYPGDRWKVGASRDSGNSMQRYDDDFWRALKRDPIESSSVELPLLKRAAATYFRQCDHKNNRLLLRAMAPARIRLKDLEINLELSFRKGLVHKNASQHDIAMSSDSLLYCLNWDWGAETLAINGRYEVPKSGKPSRFFRIFQVGRHNAVGTNVDLSFLGYQVIQKAKEVAQL